MDSSVSLSYGWYGGGEVGNPTFLAGKFFVAGKICVYVSFHG